MKRGGKFLVSTTALAVAACGGEQENLRVRSIPTPLAQGTRTVPFRIAEARGQLALGNVALALEGFRKAWRDDANSVDALAGMAICYDRMGRFDLSRRNYEAALAVAPADVELLGAFARSLQLQGELAEAERVRVEIAQRVAAQSPTETPQLLALRPLPTPAPEIAAHEIQPSRVETSVPMALAASPSIVTEEEVQEAPISRPALAAAPLQLAGTSATDSRIDVSAPDLPAPKMVAEAASPVSMPAPQAASEPAVGHSVTIKLPPARRVESPPSDVAMAAAEEPPLKPYDRPVPKPAVVDEQGPRLERLSMGEIGLVTAPGPMWRATAVAQTELSTKVRFVPLRQASIYPVKVRLLNAARVNRLAARTRNWLTARGWRSLAIGDARTTRTRSVVYYPASKRVLAQRLAAQFGFALAPRASGSHITVLLGDDAARHPALKARRA